MTSDKLVSVIVNTFNDADVLPEALLSALNQTWQHLEIIVYDNASSDNTSEILRDIRDERICLVVAKQHANLSAARNSALDWATGDYVCFLDSDDLWAPQKIALQVETMEDMELDFCFTNFQFSENGQIRRPIFRKGALDAVLHEIPFEIGYPVALSTLLFKKESLGKAPFEEDTHITGDYRLVTRSARKGSWRMLAEPLAIIARRPNGESASKALLMVEELVHYADTLWVQGEKTASSFVRLRALEIAVQKLRADWHKSGLLRQIMSKPYFLRYAPTYTFYRIRQISLMRR